MGGTTLVTFPLEKFRQLLGFPGLARESMLSGPRLALVSSRDGAYLKFFRR